MILGIIPARGGSKGLPGKNIKLLNGIPLMGYTIHAAKVAKYIDHLVVSTDDSKISDFSKGEGVEVINRPAEFATDQSNIDGALKHAVLEVERKTSKKVQVVVWLQPNVPIRKKGDIDLMITELLEKEADSIVSVTKSSWPIEKAYKLKNANEVVPYFGKFPNGARRQDYEDSYFCNGSIYVMKRDCLMREPIECDSYCYFFGSKRLAYIMEEEKYGIEIDTLHDFLVCEMYLKKEDI